MGGITKRWVFGSVSTGIYLVTVIYDGTQTGDANRLKCWLNGVAQTITFDVSVDSSLSSNGYITLGAASSDEAFMIGQIGEVIFWDSARTAQRAADEATLMTKWGL